MKITQRIASGVIVVALAITFVAAGFVACTLPFVTQAFSSMFSADDVSPFSRAQLTRVAEATRDFSFGAHDERALYQTIYDLDVEYAQQLAGQEADAGSGAGASAGAGTGAGVVVPAGFPRLDVVTDANDVDQLKAAFAGASEKYCYSEAAVAHLDDCYKLVERARPVLVIAAVVAVAGVVCVAKVWGRRALGGVLLCAGVVVLAAFVVLGVWAAVDFFGLFTVFHQLFFSQGNWQFPYDSLMICALPTEFWMGMGGVWLGTAIVCAVASLLVGWRLVRRSSEA